MIHSISSRTFQCLPPRLLRLSSVTQRRALSTLGLTRSFAALTLAQDAPVVVSGRNKYYPIKDFIYRPVRELSSTSLTEPTNLIVVHVSVTCKPGTEDAFKAACLANARESVKEPGVSRFDVLQHTDDPTKFCLVEVFKTKDAPGAHKETEHYKVWRETVEDMMAMPRSAVKYENLFPSTGAGWDYAEGVDLE